MATLKYNGTNYPLADGFDVAKFRNDSALAVLGKQHPWIEVDLEVGSSIVLLFSPGTDAILHSL